MQTFVIGLLLAAVSATTVVAFKHPKGFARLFPYLLGTVTLIFAGATVWHLATEVTWRSLAQFIAPAAKIEAEAAKLRLSLPYLWVAFWYIAVAVFLWANLRLPPFLQIADEIDAPDNNGSLEKHS